MNTRTQTKPKFFDCVQHTIEQLNALNESCDGCLIETDQREELCLLILAAAKDAGLESDDDVTEQWRNGELI